jgi:hypothetical protein
LRCGFGIPFGKTKAGSIPAALVKLLKKVVAMFRGVWKLKASSIPDMKNHQFKQQSIIRHDSCRGWIPSAGGALLFGLER